MRADNEVLLGEAGRHLADDVHIVLEQPPQVAEALGAVSEASPV